MVTYSEQSQRDFEEMLHGLFTWKKHELNFDHVVSYIRDIRGICDKLDKKIIHFNAVYATHKRYGDKVHTYTRNKRTTWYIIYNRDAFGNVLINKITSNYKTV